MKATVLLLLVLLVGCETNNHELLLGENNFFPLQVGNYWEFRPSAQNPVNDQVVIKMEITATEVFSGLEYYLMVTKSEGPGSTYTDSAYYRIDKKGFVLKRFKSGEINNPYRLEANDGAEWHLSDTSTEEDMTVTYYKDPIEINSTEIDNCRLFSYDVENWADEEHYTTLAPGIGIVTMYSAWGFRKELKKAIINGTEYNF